MITLKATMWPLGNEAQAYELVHATIENRTRIYDSVGDDDRFMAHVCSRPNRWLGVSGYEADVEVRHFKRSDGPAALIIAVLGAAYQTDNKLPETQCLSRVTIEDAADFERRLRARS